MSVVSIAQLYPGGVREVLKHKGEEYSLQWGDTAPFARLAAKFGAVVVPFAIVGADDAYSLAVDTKEILESPAGPFLRDLIGTYSGCCYGSCGHSNQQTPFRILYPTKRHELILFCGLLSGGPHPTPCLQLPP